MAPHSKPFAGDENGSCINEGSPIASSASQHDLRSLSSNLISSSNTSSPSSQQQQHSKAKSKPLYIRVPATVSLPILVLVDMFAVSLVVPLLFQYYKTAGVTQANQRELLSSLFSTSQIVGGLLLGFLNDARLVKRRTILFLSFGGSAVSYALIVYGGLNALIFSRILVGLVKQTMTVTTTMLTNSTTPQHRARYIGRLSASSTVAWIIGPSTGAILYKYVDTRAPALVACALFLLNMVLTALLLPDEDAVVETERGGNEKPRPWTTLRTTLKSCFSSRALGSVIVAKLIFTWVNKSTNYSQLGSFYEEFYGLEPHQRGYISSFQQLLQFMVQALLVGPILHKIGNERMATCLFTAILAVAVGLEARQQSLLFFLGGLCPIIALCFSMMHLSLQTMVTQVAPSHSIFSVLAALDLLQNAVSVSVPFYRTHLFRSLASDSQAAMQGDPDPKSWILLSAAHWACASLVMAYLLLSTKTVPSAKPKTN